MLVMFGDVECGFGFRCKLESHQPNRNEQI